MVQVGPALTLIDLSVSGTSDGIYKAAIRENGDISAGPASVGGIWEGNKVDGRGVLGTVAVEGGKGALFVDSPVEVWEIVGRSVVMGKVGADLKKGDPDCLVGVVARSAGVWDNEKMVCSCSGKTVWEEREEQKGKGMM